MPLDRNLATNVTIQLLITVVMSVLFTYVVEKVSYKGYLNLAILTVMITVITAIMNHSWTIKALMFVVLAIFCVITIGITGQIIGYSD